MFHKISQHFKQITQAMAKQPNRTFKSSAQNQKTQSPRQDFDPNKTPTMGDIYCGPGHADIPAKCHIITYGIQMFGIFAGMGIYDYMKSKPDHKQAQDDDNPAPKEPGK